MRFLLLLLRTRPPFRRHGARVALFVGWVFGWVGVMVWRLLKLLVEVLEGLKLR